MRRTIILNITLFVVVGCQSTYSGTNNEVTREIKQIPKIDAFVDSFLKSHPNVFQNSAINEMANKDLKNAYLRHTDVIQDVPLTLRSITKEDGKYFAQFYSASNDTLKFDYNLEVITPLTALDIQELKEKSIYKVTGKFDKFLEMYSRSILTGEKVYNDISISRPFDKPTISLGYIQLKNPKFIKVAEGKD